MAFGPGQLLITLAVAFRVVEVDFSELILHLFSENQEKMHGNLIAGNTAAESIKRVAMVFGAWFVISIVLAWAYNEFIGSEAILELTHRDEDQEDVRDPEGMKLDAHQMLSFAVTMASGVVGVRLLLEAVEAYSGLSTCGVLTGASHCPHQMKLNATVVAVAPPPVEAQPAPMDSSYPVDNGTVGYGEQQVQPQLPAPEARQAPPVAYTSQYPQPPLNRQYV